MDAIVKKRGILKAQLTRFETFLADESNHNKLSELQIRYDKAEPLLGKYDEIQLSIELLDNSDDESEERETFESNYYRIISKGKSLIQRSSVVNEETNGIRPNQLVHSEPYQTPKINLPVLRLPIFEGNFDDWLSFSDMFTNIVHTNNSLNNIEKFHYLRSCLKGEALNVVASLDLTSTSYVIAWNLLQDRYNNKPLIIQKHVHALFNLPQLKNESVLDLRELFNNANKQIRSLNSLGEPTEQWSTLLIYLITSKFDSTTFKEWQSFLKPNQIPTMNMLNEFLNHRFNMLESMTFNQSQLSVAQCNNNQGCRQYGLQKFEHSVQHGVNRQTNKQLNCPVCGSNQHAIFQCSSFLRLSTSERVSKVKQLNMCTNCLKVHKGPCLSLKTCRHCNLKHNSLLCLKVNTSSKGNVHNEILPSISNIQNLSTNALSNLSESHVLLSTVLVDVIAPHGKYVSCRALLDSGSQANFITESLSKKLQLKKDSVSFSVTGISCQSNSVTNKVKVSIKSRTTSFCTQLDFLVLPKLTDTLPSIVLPDITKLISSHLQVPLADPTYNLPHKVDMILGAQLFWDVLCNDTLELSQSGSPIILRETTLGWILTGAITLPVSNIQQKDSYFVSTDSLDDNIQRFWDLEQFHSEDHHFQSVLTGEDLICETHYQETTVRLPDGRYQVKIPFKEDTSTLGSTKSLAVKRFWSLENKLCRNPVLYNEYRKFMEEYENLGHMECKGNIDAMNSFVNPSYFIPHHSVIKESSTTTKLRVVFDCSAKSSSGISLNDISMNGPRVQDDLFPILIRFRMHQYVFSADIEKMYRQVLINPAQHNLQSIIWRNDKSTPMKIYVLKTVTYGSKSAPFLATRTLKQLAKDEEKNFPNSVEVLLNDFYIDDVLSGSQTIQSTLQLQQELTALLHKGGFHLRKWSSNLPELLSNLPREDVEVYPFHDFDDTLCTVKTLGLLWNTSLDVFKYSINQEHKLQEKSITKRNVLSNIAKIFDPLGLIGPIILKAKLIMQRIWKEGMNWDDKLPEWLNNQWTQFSNSLSCLNSLTINRYVLCLNKKSTMELHGFADASTVAYGVCLYIRCEDDQGNITVNLLSSRSRVAPLKVISLPRLELCAALLLSQLSQSVVRALNFDKANVYYYTDSTIVLSWLQASSSHFSTFVANRISDIQSHTTIDHWKHVSSSENPADIISRGCDGENLITSTLWWQGPLWLRQGVQFWKQQGFTQPFIEFKLLPEVRKQSLNTCSSTTTDEIDIFNRFSSLQKLTRVMAYCLRFYHNLKAKHELHKSGILTVDELNQSQTKLVQLSQLQSFKQELITLRKNSYVSKPSKLLQLNPFLDERGLIRVGGRLKNSNLTPDQKHPIVLDHKHKLTRLIAEQMHKEFNHAGPQLLLSTMRHTYWPLNGRSLVRTVVHKCIKCFKAKPRVLDQQMGQLPQVRVTPARPFSNTGCDFFGPIYVKTSNHRKAQPTKTYVALFVCLCIKAIHLELVEDLTTESFLAALKRFISRRGKPTTMHSDNAKTFIGADNELQELKNLWISQIHKDKVETFLSNQGIKWSFIPPLSPNFGGLWESGVRLVKNHLYRVVQNTNLRLMEMITLLTQIEACVNSRPITVMSSEPSDLVPLTPAHFLIGDSLLSHPEPDLTHLKISSLSRWQYIQQLTQHFWKRWNNEYVSQLQHMVKWNVKKSNIKIDDIMLLQDDSSLPCSWTIGKVIEVFPDKEGLVRVVSVKTKNGIFKRSITKLCPLPINDEVYF